MPPSPPDKLGLPPTVVSALSKLSAAALCTQLSTFLGTATTVGIQGALDGLDLVTGMAIAAVATIFGATESCESGKDRERAKALAEELKTLSEQVSKRDGTAVDLLKDIANGKITIRARLSEMDQKTLAQRIAVTLLEAGLATADELRQFRDETREAHLEDRIYHETADLLLREILRVVQVLLERADGREAEPPPTNNFAQAGVIHNADFVGRVEILKELHERLEQGDVAITHDLPGTEATAQALRGEGGIGKTQIAIEYANRHANDYTGCWWIDASKEAIDASAASLATTLGWPPGPKDTPEQISAAIRGKLSTDRHLLILDNVEDPDCVKDFLLQAPSRVLITTRLRSLPTGFVDEFPVSVFERHESIALLRKHRSDLTRPEDQEALDRVADHLGDHALAVTVTAAYLRKRPNVTPAELLERLQRAELGDKAHLLDKLDPNEHAAGYRLSVAGSLSLHLPDFRDTPAMDVLAVAAFCHPDNIPIDLFYDAPDLSRESVEDRLVRLADVSIIRYEGKTVSIHRLMQEVIRVELSTEPRASARAEHQPGSGRTMAHAHLERLIGDLAKRFKNPEDYRNWAIQDAYAAHAEAAIEHAERVGEIPQVAFLANQLGVYFQNRARFDSGLSALRAAERIDRAALGDHHPNVAIRVNNIGLVLRAKGDLDGALKCFREPERIDRAAFGDNHPNVARYVNNIGGVLQDKGDLDGALECFREAERIDRAAFGDNHPQVAIFVNNIAGVLQGKGDLDGAFERYREAERIWRASLGDNHPDVATCVNNIGSVLKDKGDLDGALKCYREAERIDRAAFGDEHPDVARDVNNIGSVLFAKGDHDGAREMMREAFRMKLTTVGPRALTSLTGAGWLITLGLDPLALAREIAGEEVADQLRDTLAEGGDA